MSLGTAKLITELMLKDRCHLIAGLSIMENEGAVRALLLVPLMEEVRAGLKQGRQFLEPEWKFDGAEDDLIAALKNGQDGQYTGIFIRRLTWPVGCAIGISPQRKTTGELIYGIYWPGADQPDGFTETENNLRRELSSELHEMGNQGSSSDYWLWYQTVPPLGSIQANDLGNIQTIREIYSDHREEIVHHFIALFDRLAEIVSGVFPGPGTQERSHQPEQASDVGRR